MTSNENTTFIAAVKACIAAHISKETLIELLNKEYDNAAALERSKCLSDITAAINAYEKKYGATFTGKLEFAASSSTTKTSVAPTSTPKSSTISEWLRANNIN